MKKTRLLTVVEVAKLLRKKPSTIYTHCRNGEIPFARIGRSIRFDRETLMGWIRAGGMPAKKK